MTKKLSIILIKLLFAQALLFQVDLPQLVLCFGDDGHIAIEKTNGSMSEHEGLHFTKAAAVLQTINEAHADCTDIKLDWHFSNAKIVKLKNKTFRDNTSLYVPFSPLQHANLFLTRAYTIRPNLNVQTAQVIHTTILLI